MSLVSPRESTQACTRKYPVALGALETTVHRALGAFTGPFRTRYDLVFGRGCVRVLEDPKDVCRLAPQLPRSSRMHLTKRRLRHCYGLRAVATACAIAGFAIAGLCLTQVLALASKAQ